MAIQKSQDGWREIKIDSASSKPETTTVLTPPYTATKKQTETLNSIDNSNFRLVAPPSDASARTLGGASRRFEDLPIGTRVEVSPASFKIAHQIAKLLSTKSSPSSRGGAALIVDYGGDHSYGNSFRVAI